MQVQTDSYPPAEPSPDPATRGEAAYAAWWRSPVFAPVLALVLLTLLGGAARFSFLNRPCLWGDEALVYWRTSGTYGQMLDVLQDDGFVPLHYELAWAISRVARPTPFVLRMVPALCGTLLIPAVYWLSRQMLGVRPSLIAAALTTCSAFTFLLQPRREDVRRGVAVRDDLASGFAVLDALWREYALAHLGRGWMRRGRISSDGIAAARGVAVDAVDGPNRAMATGAVAGRRLLVCAAGPVGYYTQFNRWTSGSTRWAGGRAA